MGESTGDAARGEEPAAPEEEEHPAHPPHGDVLDGVGRRELSAEVTAAAAGVDEPKED